MNLNQKTILSELIERTELWMKIIKECDKNNNVGILWSMQYRTGIPQEELLKLISDTEMLINEVRAIHG